MGNKLPPPPPFVQLVFLVMFNFPNFLMFFPLPFFIWLLLHCYFPSLPPSTLATFPFFPSPSPNILPCNTALVWCQPGHNQLQASLTKHTMQLPFPTGAHNPGSGEAQLTSLGSLFFCRETCQFCFEPVITPGRLLHGIRQNPCYHFNLLRFAYT